MHPGCFTQGGIASYGKSVFVTCSNAGPNQNQSHVYRIDTTTDTKSGFFNFPSGHIPSGIAADASSVWVTQYTAPAVLSRIARSDKSLHEFPIGTRGTGVSIDTSGNVWALDENGEVDVFSSPPPPVSRLQTFGPDDTNFVNANAFGVFTQRSPETPCN